MAASRTSSVTVYVPTVSVLTGTVYDVAGDATSADSTTPVPLYTANLYDSDDADDGDASGSYDDAADNTTLSDCATRRAGPPVSTAMSDCCVTMTVYDNDVVFVGVSMYDAVTVTV